MKKFLIRTAINGVALYAAVKMVSGIHPQAESWLSMLLLAAVFGLVNAVVGPIIKLLTCPLIFLTLGAGLLLVNTLLFTLAGQIGTAFGFGFTVDGFWPAFFGALVVSVVSFVLNLFVRDDR